MKPSTKAWHRFYDTVRWRMMRLNQLRQHPLCEHCLRLGFVKAAKIVHHITPHKGDWDLFCTSPLESLCKACHDSIYQSNEHVGFNKGVDVNGKPLRGDDWIKKQRRKAGGTEIL